MTVNIAPSLLSADFLKLKEEIVSLEKAGADVLHLDIMDGHFVPNLTFGPDIVKQIRRATSLPLDAHLMITDPAAYAPRFIDAGVNYLSFHKEAIADPYPLIHLLHDNGVLAGMAINPETSISEIFPYLDVLDYVLIMTVHPGFGGQTFIDCSDKIRVVNNHKHTENFFIEVDGGINQETAAIVKEAGASLLVAGSFIFKNPPYSSTIQGLKHV